MMRLFKSHTAVLAWRAVINPLIIKEPPKTFPGLFKCLKVGKVRYIYESIAHSLRYCNASLCVGRKCCKCNRGSNQEGGGKPGTGGWLECGEGKGRIREDSHQLNKKKGGGDNLFI